MRKNNFDLSLSKLRAYYWDKWILPTFDTMKDLMWIKSRDGVSRFFNKLIEESYLEKETSKKYIPTEKMKSFPVYESVSCWVANEVESEPISTINIDKYIIWWNPNWIVLVEVKWDSMEGVWIYEWDIVSLDINNKYPRSWDLVIASIDWDNEFTLKRYEKDKFGGFILQYQNEDLYPWKIIEATESIKIVGVVKWLVRQF